MTQTKKNTVKGVKAGCIVWGLVFKGDKNDTDPIHFYNGVCVYPSRRMALEDSTNWGGKKAVMVKKFLITHITKITKK